MNFAWAIERNRLALMRIVATFFAMLGCAETAMMGLIPRDIHRAILRDLRPAENALRQLIAAVALGIVAKPKASRPIAAGGIAGKDKGKGGRPVFKLQDSSPRAKNRKRGGGSSASAASPRSEGATVGGARLLRRLQAMMNALENLSREARRLVRSRAKRGNVAEQRHPIRAFAPSYAGKKPGHEIEEKLGDFRALVSDERLLDSS